MVFRAMSSSPSPELSRITAALSEQRNALHEQLNAAWQLQVSRIEEQLHSGWKEDIERAVGELFSNLAAKLEREAAVEAERARRSSGERLNAAVRRLVQAQGEDDWAGALADAAAMFAPRVAVLGVNGGNLRALAARGIENIAGAEIPIAPAFASAISTREPVAALRNAAEISEPLATAVSAHEAAKGMALPVAGRDRVFAVLYADGDDLEASGLEVVATIAGAHRQAALVPEQRPAAPEWTPIAAGDQDLHLRAQRFARVRVAEIRLYKSEACLAGRTQTHLSSVLKKDIDAAREAFHRDFMAASPAMPDYLHLELIRTLANNDVAVLGDDYPGPLF